METNFVKEAGPIIVLYYFFLEGLILNFCAWVEIYADNPSTIVSCFLFGRLRTQFIRKYPLLYRILSTLVFGVTPVYFLISHGYKHRTSLYLLLVLYSMWIFEKIIRMIISKTTPKKENFPPESFQACSACHKPVMKIMLECPHCQNKLRL